MTPDWYVIVALCVVAAAAGWVDAVSGGGGLLQLPALLIALPDQEPSIALGTNKMSSILGTSAAAITYGRVERPRLSTALPMALAAFAGAAAGSAVAVHLPAAIFRPIILVALIVVWCFIAFRRDMGLVARETSRRRHLVTAIGGGVAIGVYDGAIGPGTGSFLVILLVAALGYTFLQASATAKIVNVGTNLASLIVFGLAGSVLWVVGLLMGACNVAGAIVGARMAMAKGSEFVRIVLLAVTAALIVVLAVQIVRGS
ncbi:MAG: sulfite exporter TauE/SafE family protein [Actinomycetota bacterium]